MSDGHRSGVSHTPFTSHWRSVVDGRRDALKRMPSPVHIDMERSKVHGCDRAHQISWKYADADLLVAPVDEWARGYDE